MKSSWSLGAFFIVASTVLWGSTFVVIKDALGQVGPLELVTLHSGIAALLSLPFLHWKNARTLRAGLELGLWMGMGHILQTVGLIHTTANKSAFLTALYVIFVPFLSLLKGQRVTPIIWCSSCLALLGSWLLTYATTPPNFGDVLTVLSAFMYAMSIVRLETLSHAGRSLDLAGLQAIGAFGLGLMFGIPGGLHMETRIPWGASLYLGGVIGLGCVVLQTEGQKRIPAPSVAVLSVMEPLWASLFAYVFHGERWSIQGLFGAVLIVFSLGLVGVLDSKRFAKEDRDRAFSSIR